MTIEYSYIELHKKATRPDRKGIGDKTAYFRAFADDERKRRMLHITREGDTVTVKSADPATSFRVLELPWSSIAFAELYARRQAEQPAPQAQPGGKFKPQS